MIQTHVSWAFESSIPCHYNTVFSELQVYSTHEIKAMWLSESRWLWYQNCVFWCFTLSFSYTNYLKKEMIVFSVFPISLHFLLNGMNALYVAFQLIWKQSLSFCVRQSFTITPEVKEENSNHDLDVIKVYMDDVEFVLVTFLNTSIL